MMSCMPPVEGKPWLPVTQARAHRTEEEYGYLGAREATCHAGKGRESTKCELQLVS